MGVGEEKVGPEGKQRETRREVKRGRIRLETELEAKWPIVSSMEFH